MNKKVRILNIIIQKLKSEPGNKKKIQKLQQEVDRILSTSSSSPPSY